MIHRDEMPDVGACNVSACAYNGGGECHAKAITIGDGVHPGCDTFFISEREKPDAALRAGVGACKVTGCHHNHKLECTADSVHVTYRNGGPNCATHDPA
ncbi:MAG: DUF1540 domain-containing protein [Myxococcales bacterium]|jgi:hypothetical protein